MPQSTCLRNGPHPLPISHLDLGFPFPLLHIFPSHHLSNVTYPGNLPPRSPLSPGNSSHPGPVQVCGGSHDLCLAHPLGAVLPKNKTGHSWMLGNELHICLTCCPVTASRLQQGSCHCPWCSASVSQQVHLQAALLVPWRCSSAWQNETRNTLFFSFLLFFLNRKALYDNWTSFHFKLISKLNFGLFN